VNSCSVGPDPFITIDVYTYNIDAKIYVTRANDLGRMTGNPEVTPQNRLSPRCPEVGFEEISIDLLQARFWPTSGSPTIRELSNTTGIRRQ